MPLPRLFPAALVALLMAVPATAADRGPSTPEERAKVVRLAAEATQDPLKVHATEGRWFAKWIDEVPDLAFGPEAPARWMEGAVTGDLRRVAIFTYELGGVAHMIQHGLTDPRKAPDHGLAVHTAALEGVVRAYGVLRDLKPGNRSPKMDEALARLEQGTFPAFVKDLFGKTK
jgi:carboxypeptidase Q